MVSWSPGIQKHTQTFKFGAHSRHDRFHKLFRVHFRRATRPRQTSTSSSTTSSTRSTSAQPPTSPSTADKRKRTAPSARPSIRYEQRVLWIFCRKSKNIERQNVDLKCRITPIYVLICPQNVVQKYRQIPVLSIDPLSNICFGVHCSQSP
jgi:hypothetical protein